MAHKKAGSSSKNGRDSVGQRLGVKAGDGQLVTAGSIIVRQRGMTFLAGEGAGLGRDYTVFATVTGKVRFEHATKAKKRIRVEAADRGRARPAPAPVADDHRRATTRTDGAGGDPREARHPSQVLPGQGPLRLVRHDVHRRLDPARSSASTSAATATRSTRASRRSSTRPARSSASRSAWSARPGPSRAAAAQGDERGPAARPSARTPVPGAPTRAGRLRHGALHLRRSGPDRGRPDARSRRDRGRLPPSRRPDRLATERLDAGFHGRRWAKLPFVRGLVVLYETLVVGTRWLVRSAILAAPRKRASSSAAGRSRSCSAMTLRAGIGMFFLLPLFIASVTTGQIDNGLVQHLVEGLIRVAIFLGYLVLIAQAAGRPARLPVPRRRAHDDPRPRGRRPADRAARSASTRPPTRAAAPSSSSSSSPLSILVFSLVGRQTPVVMVASRILLIPVIAAVGYELLRFGARHRANPVVRAIMLPGHLGPEDHDAAADRRHDRGRHRLDGAGPGGRRRGRSRTAAPRRARAAGRRRSADPGTPRRMPAVEAPL